MRTRTARRQYELIHEIYVLSDDCDRRLLGPFGLNPSHFRLMRNLGRDGGERLTFLSQRLLLSKSTITRVVDQLERAGMVRRAPDSADRRAQRVVLTEEGARMRARIIAGHDHSLERRSSVLTAAEQEELNAILAKLREGLIADLSRDGNGSA
jgi:DNA-binding MarR family transcriptional regulator